MELVMFALFVSAELTVLWWIDIWVLSFGLLAFQGHAWYYDSSLLLDVSKNEALVHMFEVIVWSSLLSMNFIHWEVVKIQTKMKRFSQIYISLLIRFTLVLFLKIQPFRFDEYSLTSMSMNYFFFSILFPWSSIAMDL